MILPAIAAQNLAAPGPGPPAGGMPFGPFLVYGLNLVPPTQPALSLRKSIAAALKADPALAAIVAGRLDPIRVRQGRAWPAITYQVVSNVPGQNLDGPDGVARARVRLVGLSDLIEDCDAIAEAFRALLDGFRGRLGGPGGVEVTDAVMLGSFDNYSDPVDGSDDGPYSVAVDVALRYRLPANPANVH